MIFLCLRSCGHRNSFAWRRVSCAVVVMIRVMLGPGGGALTHLFSREFCLAHHLCAAVDVRLAAPLFFGAALGFGEGDKNMRYPFRRRGQKRFWAPFCRKRNLVFRSFQMCFSLMSVSSV